MEHIENGGQDEVFKDEITKASDFKFGTTVVKVFDDMVSRSVPFYNETQRMLAEIAADHVKEGSFLYDLGCSTGTTLIEVDKLIPSDIKFIGIDESPEMLEKCDLKFKEAGFVRPYDLQSGDLQQETLPISNASVVILCLTMQFVRPLYRERLLRNIYDGLNPGGVLLLVEKVLAESTVFNRDFIKYYYNYKRRNHYSELEISQKREALENVLIPYKLSENMLLLKEAGFADCEIFFKWYNFSGMIAYKK
ncbi:carboxy-S-adenosyl-L-methionine synthase CmoA [Dyadobacter sp. Leaf189]|uniref:carboxy-S-adenosyl-L-methionine synthase CmoA n=1 Tax=Dyadobacter sp. Leaf189 TaxID=1736295 RepID=UPI0006F2EA02|nr:carboxy-S-adenosyl-L-methionine synthase CmoA [Dyadobacter sp. Leaf189]KQS31122.1 tRNA (cmo5U34)-methyltransferase [Dyadobacter sp. Leaf189]